jgi:uncharacterized membrane protein YgcG
MNASNFFTKEQKEDIKLAIKDAELDTSGEIRVHLELNCEQDSMTQAAQIFKRLKMEKTIHRNAVLIYLAIDSRKFAIIGDEGINAIVPNDFWNDVKTNMLIHFRQADFVNGILSSVNMVGEKLKQHFPHKRDDVNELADDISFDDNKELSEKVDAEN